MNNKPGRWAFDAESIQESIVNTGELNNYGNITIQHIDYLQVPSEVVEGQILKPKIFISYARADDEAFVKQLYEKLIEENYTVWWDRVSMPSRGLSFLTEIREAINRSDKLLLVLGPEAIASDYVQAEWQYALSICLPVIPLLRLGEYEQIPAGLTHYHTPDVRSARPFTTAYEEVKRLIDQPAAKMADLVRVLSLPAWHVKRAERIQPIVEQLMIDANQPVVVDQMETVAIWGMGGNGKSTLASEICHSCAIRSGFPDGIFWVRLGKDPNIPALQADIGAHFGDDRSAYQNADSGKSLLEKILRNKSVLLVLDDVWQARDVQYFASLPARSRLLLTTRNRLIANQLTHPDKRFELSQMSLAEGIRFFNLRMGRAADAQSAYIADERTIIEYLGGHTLSLAIAIALIAEKGEDYSPKLLKRLQKADKTIFDYLNLSEDDKNENVSLSLALSYQDLSEDLQRRFRALGVLAIDARISLSLAKGLWEDEDADDAEDALEELVRYALVQKSEAGEYKQHVVLRAYAVAMLKEQNEWNDAVGLYIAAMVPVVTQFTTLPVYEWLQFEPDLPHLFLICDYLTALFELYPDDPDVLTVCAAYAISMGVFLDQRREFHHLDWLITGAKAAERNQDYITQAYILNLCGLISDGYGQRKEALNYFEQAGALFKDYDPDNLGMIYNNIATVYAGMGDYNKSRAILEEAIDLLRAGDDLVLLNRSLNNLAETYRTQGHFERAIELYDEALELSRSTGDKRGEAVVLNNLGETNRGIARLTEAMEFYQASMEIAEAIVDRNHVGMVMANIGTTLVQQGRYDQALAQLLKALEVQGEVQNLMIQGRTYSNIGELYRVQGRFAEAMPYFEKALRIGEQVDDITQTGITLQHIGEMLLAQAQPQPAMEYFNQAMEIHQTSENLPAIAVTRHDIATAQLQLGQVDLAINGLLEAEERLQVVGDWMTRSITLANIGVAYREKGDYEQAIEYVNAAVGEMARLAHPMLELHQQLLGTYIGEKLYLEGGEPFLRSQLTNFGLAEDVIDSLVDYLKSTFPDV